MTLTIEPHQTTYPCPCGEGNGNPTWCHLCTEAFDGALERLPRLTALAARRRDGRLVAGRTGDVERHGKHPFPPSASPAWDEVQKVIAWTRRWCERLADQLGKRHAHLGSYNNAGLPIDEVDSDVDYLRRFLGPLLVGPWAYDFGTELAQKAAAVERLAGEEMARHPLPAPCPRCDRLSLSRLDGSERVECGAPDCTQVMTLGEYRVLVAALAAGGGW